VGVVGYEEMHTQNQTYRSTRLRKNEETAASMIWVERGGNSLGREVWVENDAGEETHTVAAPLVDGQQVVRIKW